LARILFFFDTNYFLRKDNQMSKRLLLIVAAVALLAVMVGCSKPPETEIQNATTALDAAKAAEAETYVPDSFNAAMESYNAAEAAKKEQDSKFALFRSYGKTKEMYAQAAEMLNNVTSEAATEKDKVRQQVTDDLVSAKAVVDSASAAVAKAPRGKGSKADIELIKGELANVQAAYADADSSFNDGQYKVAQTKLMSVVEGAHNVINEIRDATARKAGKAVPKTGM
jgi:ElaB/YqjD/DUF883 family membrane-anchored ribosome-binding protein